MRSRSRKSMLSLTCRPCELQETPEIKKKKKCGEQLSVSIYIYILNHIVKHVFIFSNISRLLSIAATAMMNFYWLKFSLTGIKYFCIDVFWSMYVCCVHLKCIFVHVTLWAVKESVDCCALNHVQPLPSWLWLCLWCFLTVKCEQVIVYCCEDEIHLTKSFLGLETISVKLTGCLCWYWSCFSC